MIPPIKLPVPIINRIFIIKTTLQRLYGTNVLFLHINKNIKMKTSITQLAKMIDHSILHPMLTDADLKKECAVAVKYNVASVCVKPYMVPMAKELLKGSDVLVGCVIGFPAGNSTIASKVFETEEACKNGAVEVDMVINIGKALQGDWDYVEKEIDAVTKTCHKHGAIVKVIFETDFVTKEADIIKLCQICTKVKADFVKTSTGFGNAGAEIKDVQIMKESIKSKAAIKASGGIRDFETAMQYINLGVTRIGTSNGIAIITGQKGNEQTY